MITDGGAAVLVTSDVTGGSEVNRVLSSIIAIGEPEPESPENRCDFLLHKHKYGTF